jgi:hypothetical protein
MKRATALALIASLSATSAGPALGHHSFAAAYDMETPISVTGAIVEVRLTNPHSHFFLDVENEAGEIERWTFEAGTPSGMIRNGYSPSVIREGDVVTISGFHARDMTKNAGMLTALVTADGTTYGMFGPREGAGR